MRKWIMIFLVTCVVVLSGCSLFGKKITNEEVSGSGDVVNTTGNALVESVKGKYVFEDGNCNKYVALMECLLDKTPDNAKEQTANSFVKVMELRQGLEKTALPETCKNTMNMLQDQKEVFAKAGCELK